MTDSLLSIAEDASFKLLEQLKDDVGDSIENEGVRRVMTISLSLVEQVGTEGFDMIERLLAGDKVDESVFSEHLSLLEISDLLDMAQSLEAKDRAAVNRLGIAFKNTGMQIASTVLKAAILAI